ncbi:uncharacterized protein BDV17DRAFT_155606 [Aspergillus undulatus]|uniref:uncharacterized protein n=1 Tax=Aspergillus undulatus TaxID=1810928 RepID=UPI003CCD46C3
MLVENSKQLLRTLKETFPNQNLEEGRILANCYPSSQSGLDKAQCAWARAQEILFQHDATGGNDVQAEIESALLHFLKASQDVMSGTASNYDLKYLSLGICIAGLAVLFTLPATYKALSKNRQSGLFLTTSILLHGTMMFASSYVEEEQQFWYWIFTGWVFYLHARSIQSQRHYSLSADKVPRSLTHALSGVGVIALAASHRILRRWNQTGQKFAADPDIARVYFPSHQHSLWALVGLTYADVCLNLMNDYTSPLMWRLFCLAITIVGFTFKLVFAASESPELLNESPLNIVATSLNGLSLVSYARLTVGGIALLLVLSTFLSRTKNVLYRVAGK